MSVAPAGIVAVIVVVMRQKYCPKGPALFLKRSDDGVCLWRVDERCFIRFVVVKQKGIVVSEAGHGDNFEWHGVSECLR